MVSVVLPVFVIVNDCVTEEPLATLPNDPVPPPTVIVVVVVGSVALAPVKPMQPAWQMPPKRAANIKKVKGLIRRSRVTATCTFSLD